jgi:hypothetical protein
MILDEVQPLWDRRRIERRLVRAPRTLVYRAAIETDFPDAVRTNRPVRMLFAIRRGIERMVSPILGRTDAPILEPPNLRLVNIPDRGTWVKLGAYPPEEIAFGAIGRFWAGETIWEEIYEGDFATFSLSGTAKIGCHLLFTLEDAGTRVTFEARRTAADAFATGCVSRGLAS